MLWSKATAVNGGIALAFSPDGRCLLALERPQYLWMHDMPNLRPPLNEMELRTNVLTGFRANSRHQPEPLTKAERDAANKALRDLLATSDQP